MRTAKQLAASRANGQHSRGPITSEGKANSRYNALKHGIHAESQVIFTESSQELADFTAELHDQYQPGSPAERFLVDTLVHNEWRLRRLRNVEAALWQSPTTVADAFVAAAPHIERLQRIVNSCERNYHRALKELHCLQESRLAETQFETAPATVPETQQNNTESDDSGSFRRFLDRYLGMSPEESAEMDEDENEDEDEDAGSEAEDETELMHTAA